MAITQLRCPGTEKYLRQLQPTLADGWDGRSSKVFFNLVQFSSTWFNLLQISKIINMFEMGMLQNCENDTCTLHSSAISTK